MKIVQGIYTPNHKQISKKQLILMIHHSKEHTSSISQKSVVSFIFHKFPGSTTD